MAGGNVIPFPGSSGPNAGFGSLFGSATSPTAAAASEQTAVPAEASNNNQAGGGITSMPPLEHLHARMGSALNKARKATRTLVDKAVPGTIEVGLFNQFGIIQSSLASLAARAAASTGGPELAAIGQDLETVEQQVNDYVTAVNAALASAPATMPGTFTDNKKLMWAGGGLLVLAVGTGLYMYFKKPARRKRLAGLFGVGGTAAEPVRRSGGKRRTARKKSKH